jgi:dienelactone hydrolase
MRALAASVVALGALLLAPGCARPRGVEREGARGPETVIVRAGSASLHALLWRPRGPGPFPAVLLSHGSGRTPEELKRLGPYERQAHVLGPVFARHGYELLYLFRRGVGPSTDQGTNAVDLMTAEAAAHGPAARNALQMRLLEGRELADARAALAFLRARGEVDARHVALIGHSFGGSLTLLLAESEPDVRAVVVFSGAGYSWDRSAELRARLLAATGRVVAPILYIHAENDYSLRPGRELDARLAELGKPHRLKIYPPVGTSADDGHAMLYLAVSQWEPEVFAFLDDALRR